MPHTATRVSLRAVTILVLTFMLAFNGVAIAQAPAGNPLNAILAELRLIQQQQDQTDSQILMRLQDLQRQLDKLETISQHPAPTAHRVWVAPFWHDTITATVDDSLAHLWWGAHVYALNPGAIAAGVRVLYVKYFTGSRQVLQDTAGPGDRTKDLANQPDAFVSTFNGWVIVASDRPVLPYGWFTVGWFGDNEDRNDLAMHFYPIDCTNPADDTVSRVCYYADPANDPQK